MDAACRTSNVDIVYGCPVRRVSKHPSGDFLEVRLDLGLEVREGSKGLTGSAVPTYRDAARSSYSKYRTVRARCVVHAAPADTLARPPATPSDVILPAAADCTQQQQWSQYPADGGAPAAACPRAGTIIFHPQLSPSKYSAARLLGLSPAVKVMLRFRSRAWPVDCHGSVVAALPPGSGSMSGITAIDALATAPIVEFWFRDPDGGPGLQLVSGSNSLDGGGHEYPEPASEALEACWAGAALASGAYQARAPANSADGMVLSALGRRALDSVCLPEAASATFVESGESELPREDREWIAIGFAMGSRAEAILSQHASVVLARTVSQLSGMFPTRA